MCDTHVWIKTYTTVSETIKLVGLRNWENNRSSAARIFHANHVIGVLNFNGAEFAEIRKCEF